MYTADGYTGKTICAKLTGPTFLIDRDIQDVFPGQQSIRLSSATSAEHTTTPTLRQER